MLKIELQADDAGNVNLDNVTTRKVRLLGKDKELVSRFFSFKHFIARIMNI